MQSSGMALDFLVRQYKQTTKPEVPNTRAAIYIRTTFGSPVPRLWLLGSSKIPIPYPQNQPSTAVRSPAKIEISMLKANRISKRNNSGKLSTPGKVAALHGSLPILVILAF
jgi:hypothetical protein